MQNKYEKKQDQNHIPIMVRGYTNDYTKSSKKKQDSVLLYNL